jgi:hypothetical protein
MSSEAMSAMIKSSRSCASENIHMAFKRSKIEITKYHGYPDEVK